MKATDPVVGKIDVSLTTFVNTLFKNKRDDEIVYLGYLYSRTKTIS